MDRIRVILATVQKYLGGMNASQKLLIASGVVILLMTLFLVTQYASTPQMVALSREGGDEQDRLHSFLATSKWVRGVDYDLSPSGDVLVRPELKYKVVADLSQSGQLPEQTGLFFDTLFDIQSFTHTNDQHWMAYLLAKGNEQSRVISEMPGIDRAKVILNVPPTKGIGPRMTKASASVSVKMLNGDLLPQRTVDAIASFVAGSTERVGIEDVSITDGIKSYKARDPDELVLGDRLSYARGIERAFETKIEPIIGIEGARIMVTADVNLNRSQIDEKHILPQGKGSETFVTRDRSIDTSDSTSGSGAEPGLRSNTGASINQGGGSRQSSETSETETEMSPQVGTRHTKTDVPGGDWTKIVATIGIPRGSIVRMLQAQAGGDPEGEPSAPTEQEVSDAFAAQELRITEAVVEHLGATTSEGEQVAGVVRVTMLPIDAPAMGLEPGAASPSGMLFGLDLASGGGGMVERVLVGALALLAVGMMLMMVRKAGKKVELPTPEELVGIPPALTSDSDIVGEADETDTPMTGIEVDDDQAQANKMLEQVTDLVQNNPETAAKLIGRWSSLDD